MFATTARQRANRAQHREPSANELLVRLAEAAARHEKAGNFKTAATYAKLLVEADEQS